MLYLLWHIVRILRSPVIKKERMEGRTETSLPLFKYDLFLKKNMKICVFWELLSLYIFVFGLDTRISYT